MSRAMWTGMLSFGLVSIPVGLHSATEEHVMREKEYVGRPTVRSWASSALLVRV